MKTYHNQTIIAIRGINKQNYHPSIHHLIDKGLLKDCVQILIKVINGYVWINVHNKDIVEVPHA